MFHTNFQQDSGSDLGIAQTPNYCFKNVSYVGIWSQIENICACMPGLVKKMECTLRSIKMFFVLFVFFTHPPP